MAAGSATRCYAPHRRRADNAVNEGGIAAWPQVSPGIERVATHSSSAGQCVAHSADTIS